MTIQITVQLQPDGTLAAQLPGPDQSTRLVPITKLDDIKTILDGQLRAHYAIGLDGAPTKAQVLHWQKHTGPDGHFDPRCAFCKSEIIRDNIARASFERAISRARLPKINLGDGCSVRHIAPKQRGNLQQKIASPISELF